MKAAIVACLFLVLAFAGCADDPGLSGGVAGTTAPVGDVPRSSAAAPSPSADLGSLAATVVDEELRPVPGAQVTLDGTDLTAFTDEAGAATFNGLEPNTYTVLAAKPGFQAQMERGKLVEVRANEVATVELLLRPVLVISVDNSYHKSLEFRGFIACSFDSRALGYTSYCGRGLTVQGVNVGRDPNDNSTHPWQVDSQLISAMILEAKWQPSFAALGTDMMIRTGREIGCSPYACTVGAGVGASAQGRSPLRAASFDNATYSVANSINRDPAKFPYTVWSEARAHCSQACRDSYGNNILIQQRYEMWASSFYGAPPATGWTVFPS